MTSIKVLVTGTMSDTGNTANEIRDKVQKGSFSTGTENNNQLKCRMMLGDSYVIWDHREEASVLD